MMTTRLGLLSATMLAGALAGAANAQIVLPAAELRGTGATAIGDAVVRSLNCVGQPGAPGGSLNKYGTNSGALSTIAPVPYSPTTPSLTNPVLDCSTQEIQPDFQGKYVGSGSGFGRQSWRLYSNQFTGTPTNTNPFQAADGPWTKVQFAFSETPVSSGDISTYNLNANNATNKAGPAIAVPFFVIPVALPYNPRYGIRTDGEGVKDLTFNVKVPAKDAFGVVVGGLRLSKSDYCKIFNGEITNFNHPDLKTRNGNLSLRDLDDTVGRWDAEGVPIRLVGRLDRSGTTDVFTRHLAAVCDTFVTVNKFDKAAESLPYATGGPDMVPFRADTSYFPTNASTSAFAGPVQSISGAFFNRTSDLIETTAGGEAAGLFMLADGSSGVEEAIRIEGTTLKTSTFVDPGVTVTLNGKFGYVAADFVAPTPNRTLFSAALQQGTGATYVAPLAIQGTKAVGTILPPQSTVGSGAFNVNDPRPVSRANPVDWAGVLYSNPAATLANPTVGYPITAASSLFTYTCWETTGKQLGMGQFMGTLFGKVTKKSDGTTLSANTFKGTSTASFGILSKSNTGLVPAGWQTAITETFLKKSTQKSTIAAGPSAGTVVTLGTLNADPAQVATAGNGLWIQSFAPTKTADFDGINSGANKEVAGNPICTIGTGA
jgi:hypothetical protein